MNTFRVYCGMVPEYEIIATDAPQSVSIEIVRKMYCTCDVNYDYFEKYGYNVIILGCQDDFDSVPKTDFEIDLEDFEEY